MIANEKILITIELPVPYNNNDSIHISYGDIKTEMIKALETICGIYHSNCDSNCPVFRKHKIIPIHNGECICFKSGLSMLNYINE